MAWTAPKTWSGVIVTVADLNTHIRDNAQSGPYGTTFSALATAIPSPAAGAMGVVNAGSEPLPFVYDGTKWIAPPMSLLANVSGTSNSTTYQTLAAATFGNLWGTLRTAGFVPYARVSGFVQSATASETTTLAVSFGTTSSTEPSPGTEFGAVTSSGNTQEHIDTGWVTTTLPASANVLELFIRCKSSAAVGAKVQARVSLWMRWQSA